MGESRQESGRGHKIPIDDLSVEQGGGTVILKGKAADQDAMEKAVLAAGDMTGVAKVNAQIDVGEKGAPSAMYTVQSGDTLSKIAEQHYGDTMRYPAIFEANRPLLSDADKIYPGKVLRLPALD